MSHKPVKYAKPCKKRPDASIRKVFLDAIRQSHGIHPPSEITDIVFTNHRERLLRLIQVCEHFIFDATANSFMNPGGDPIGIAGVVVVRRAVSVDIAEIVRVASINGTQPPIRWVF